MKNFLTLFLRLACTLAAGGCLLIGSLTVFGSFFFEQTRSQMTWLIAGQHLALLIGGLLLVTLGCTLVKWTWLRDL